MNKFIRFMYLTSSLVVAICGGAVLADDTIPVKVAVMAGILLFSGAGASAGIIVYGGGE